MGQIENSKYLVIAGVILDQDDNQINIGGTITNNSTDQAFTNVVVVAALYEEANKLITTASGWILSTRVTNILISIRSFKRTLNQDYPLKQSLILIGIVATLLMIPVQKASAQVPDTCGETEENACVVRSEEDAEELLEEFPDAIVEVNAEKYDNLDTEEIDIDDMNGRDEDDEGDNENEGDSGVSGSSSQQAPQQAPQQQNNFQPIPPGQQNLPSAQQSGAGLNDACLKSGFSQEKCNNLLSLTTQVDIAQHSD